MRTPSGQSSEVSDSRRSVGRMKPPDGRHIDGRIDGIEGGDLRGVEIRNTDMSGASFREVGLNGVRMRGVELVGADISGDVYGLRINGVEVEPLIEAELNKRYPERALLQDRTLAGLRHAQETFDRMWETTYERVASMPPGTVDVSIDDEWSLAQTLRHLVFCTDGWLRWGGVRMFSGQPVCHIPRLPPTRQESGSTQPRRRRTTRYVKCGAAVCGRCVTTWPRPRPSRRALRQSHRRGWTSPSSSSRRSACGWRSPRSGITTGTRPETWT
jgi:hypothetical protein